jgi:hypothetical protein
VGLLVAALAAPGCARGPEPRGAVETQLFFGLARPDGAVSEGEWASFLADVVTPRFPEGLTVLDAYGQYRDETAAVRSERTRVVLLVHQGGAAADAAIAAIVAEYERRFAQRSVLRVDLPGTR